MPSFVYDVIHMCFFACVLCACVYASMCSCICPHACRDQNLMSQFSFIAYVLSQGLLLELSTLCIDSRSLTSSWNTDSANLVVFILCVLWLWVGLTLNMTFTWALEIQPVHQPWIAIALLSHLPQPWWTFRSVDSKRKWKLKMFSLDACLYGKNNRTNQ